MSAWLSVTSLVSVKRPQLDFLLLTSVVIIESFRLEKLGKIWRIRDSLVEAHNVF